MSNIVIKEDEFRSIINDLDKEITNLENTYNDIKVRGQKLDGTSDMWKSETQKVVYDYYKSVSDKFPNNIERFKSLSDYLKTTLNNYIEGEKSINKDVDNNASELNINEG